MNRDFIDICRYIKRTGIKECKIIKHPNIMNSVTFTPDEDITIMSVPCGNEFFSIRVPNKIGNLESTALLFDKGAYCSNASILIFKHQLEPIINKNNKIFIFISKDKDLEIQVELV